MARPSLARRLGAATLLTTLVFSTAACGGDDGSATESSATEEGEENDEAADEVPELSAEELYPAIIGAFEEAKTFAFTTTTSGGPQRNEVSGVMRWASDGLEMKASSTGAQAFDMIVTDKTIYIEGAGMGVPEGKKWFKIDMSDPNSLFGQLGRTMDPTTMFEAMKTPKEFELVGSEEIDGVATNEYRIVMSTADYTKALELPEEMMGSMPEEVTSQMWVDADNQPRRFVQEMEIPGADGQPVPMQIEGTYTDYGLEVEIEAPPASEVADNMPGLS